MSEYFGTDDAGDGGDQGLGGEHEDYSGGHANFGQEHDHAEHDAALAHTHFQEHDAHYEHHQHITFDDGHGGHYEVDDYTVYNEHEVEYDSTTAVEHSESDHDTSFGEEVFSELHLEKLFDHLPALDGFDQIQQGITSRGDEGFSEAAN